MRLTPLLLGPADAVFSVEAESPTLSQVGAVIAVHDTITANPVGLGLARSLWEAGLQVAVVESPGHGWSHASRTHDQPFDAFQAAVSHMADRGVDQVGLVVGSEGWREAVRFAVGDRHVFGVATASLPAPVREAALGNLSVTSLRQRGLGEVVSALMDRERRARYRRALVGKIRGVSPRRSVEPVSKTADNRIPREVKMALDADLRVLVVGGWRDKGSRVMRDLGSLRPSPDRLEVELSFEGRMADFDTIPAQIVFIDAVTRWFDRSGSELSARR